MNYQKGISQLRKYLKKHNHTRELKRLVVLEEQLSTLDDTKKEFVYDKLDKLSKRSLSVSFDSLCGEGTHNTQSWFALSLKNLFYILILLLILPIFVFGITIARAESELKVIREAFNKKIQEIDSEINHNVIAPYYFSSFDTHTCDVNSFSRMETRNNLEVSVGMIDNDNLQSLLDYYNNDDRENESDENDLFPNDIWCTVAYYTSDGKDLMAVDLWGGSKRELLSRNYYVDNKLVAVDIYNINIKYCVKNRFIVDVVSECYSEDGLLQSIHPNDTAISPIPPMVYWFFYR